MPHQQRKENQQAGDSSPSQHLNGGLAIGCCLFESFEMKTENEGELVKGELVSKQVSWNELERS